MGSNLAWLDSSREDQQRMRELIGMFSDKESLDELGIGQVRDAFSDLLFPGTSSLHTRARYLLIVPWCYQVAQKQDRTGTALTSQVEMNERTLVGTLNRAGVIDGVIGRRAGVAVKTLPSSIYWTALARFGIRNGDQIGGWDAGYLARNSEAEELTERSSGMWHPTLPPPPIGFPYELPGGLDLERHEAQWLRDRVLAGASGTLLANLVGNRSRLVESSEGPWDEPAASTDGGPTEELEHAELFSLGMHGAALLYNLLVAEFYVEQGFTTVENPVADFRDRLSDWAGHVATRQCELGNWDRDDMWRRVSGPNPRIAGNLAMRSFVNTWLDTVVSGTASAVPDSPRLRRLVQHREESAKRAQSRFVNERMLRTWSGASGSSRLTFRWRNVRRLVNDVVDGLGSGGTMLPPEERSVLTDTVRPPPGCVLDRAVALTYSLDLESALVVPLAFAGQVVRESQDPVAVMEAVRSCANRVDVFCQAGQVTVPQRGTDLLAFLEPVVHLVRRPRPGRLFHPKLWALRFRDASSEAVHTRLVVLSRNLTADRTSWDVCLRLDGAVGARTVAANRPLVSLLRRTIDLCVRALDDDRRSAVTSLADDLLHTSWDLPDGVRGLSFFALGIRGQTRPDFVGTRHLVVSPFVNEEGLAFTKPAGGGTVVSTQEELDRLPEGALDGSDVYVINALADITAGDDADRSILTGLHAKLYIVEKGQTARVLVGSANATDAAFGGNVEILAELSGGRSALGIDAMVGADAGFRRVLEPYQRGAAITEDADDRALADLIRDLAAVPLTATVEPTEDSFAIRLSSEDILPAAPEGARITAELVTRRGDAAMLEPRRRVDATFPGLAVVDVTPFVVITAQDHRGETQHTVVHAQLIGDPAGRFDEVIARQVDTPEKFLRFLALLLGLSGETSLLPGAGDGSGSWATSPSSGVLEMLLRGLVDRRTQLDDLARLVTRLESTEKGQKVLPHGFAELWQVVDTVRRDLAAEEVS